MYSALFLRVVHGLYIHKIVGNNEPSTHYTEHEKYGSNTDIRIGKLWSQVFLFAVCIFFIYVLMLNINKGVSTKKNTSILKEKIIDVVRNFMEAKPVFFKLDRYIPPEDDTNCISTASIPPDLTEASKDTAIIIPKKETLQGYNSSVLACLYHRYLQTLQRHCTRPTRVGDFVQGGWNVCTDPDAIPTKPCLVYTFSDERNYDTFSDDMAKDCNCEVYMYHPKKENKAINENLVYSNLKLGTDGGLSIDQFKTMLKEKSQKTISVLNIDINNREWEVLQELVRSGILSQTEQLSLWLHSKADTSSEGHIQRLLILRDLYDIGFRIYWMERDDKCVLENFKKVTGCYYINMIRIMNRPSPIVIPKEPEFGQMEAHQYGKLYRRYISSIQTHCKERIRIGNIPDGGWEVCHDPMFRPRNNCTVYSFGIDNDFSFDDDMVKTYGCQVFAYDPSMGKPDHRHSENVMFYATGISDKNGQKANWKMRNFETLQEETGQKGKIVDYMKMDVEFNEWNSVPQMIASGVLKYVRQFAFEIHDHRIEDDANEWFKNRLFILRDIYEAGFRIFWSHRNPACTYRSRTTGKQYCTCHEIYFINTNVAFLSI